MTYEKERAPGTYVWHGDRLTVRLKRGVAAETVARNYDCTLDQSLARRNLVECTMAASQREYRKMGNAVSGAGLNGQRHGGDESGA